MYVQLTLQKERFHEFLKGLTGLLFLECRGQIDKFLVLEFGGDGCNRRVHFLLGNKVKKN